MRVIGGRHRGAKLADLAGNKTRPTADRVRESIFNILAGERYGSPLVNGIVLDLFAGTGAIGLEALSRGAAWLNFVEKTLRRWPLLEKIFTNCSAWMIAGSLLAMLPNWQPGGVILPI